MPCDYTLKWCTFNQLPVTWHLLTVAKVEPALEFAGEIRPIFFIFFIYFFIFWPISRKRIGLPHLDFTFLESAQYFDFVGNKHGWMYTVIPYNTDVWNVQAQIWCNAFEVICPVRPYRDQSQTVFWMMQRPVGAVPSLVEHILWFPSNKEQWNYHKKQRTLTIVGI